MDEDVEINILNDTNIANVPLVSQNSDLLNCEYTVHPQWLLDKPSANPDCWYNNSIETSSEEVDQESLGLGHITTENSITDESGWTEKEKNLLERGIEIFGKSALRLSQFIGTKTSSEVRYYLKSFYSELHPIHSVKNAVPKFIQNNPLNIVPGNLLVDSQIPCISEQVVDDKISVGVKKNNKVIYNRKGPRIKIEMNSVLHKQRNKINSIRNKYLNKSVKAKNEMKLKELRAKDIPSARDTIQVETGLLLSKQEEIVNIKSKSIESSDSDIDIDVVDNCESNLEEEMFSREPDHKTTKVQVKKTKDLVHVQAEKSKNVVHSDFSNANISLRTNTYFDEVSNDVPSNINQTVMDQLSSLDIPKCELLLKKDVITDMEKIIYQELLVMGASHVKTTEIYLTLRNHVISKWQYKKPQYLTKTDIRKDINGPVDYNALCKIHTFLEQLGAINYGCGRVRYVRPLQRLIKSSEVTSCVKKSRRFKKKFINNGEGGCTVSHGADGEIIDTTIINEDPAPQKLKPVRKQPIYLMYCKPFPQTYKYNIKLNISTLLLMDFHAHSSLSEVMGLIGGTWSVDTKTLSILHYEPCKNAASSTTHCDMCPVSQAVSAERIHDFKIDLLGWFHSHPTFAPEPSQQDLDTQQVFQEWIGIGKPCVGIILAPFNRPNVLTPSEYRCLVVEKLKGDNVYSPYKFKVEIQLEDFNVDEFLGNILRIYDFINSSSDMECDSKLGITFSDPYLHDRSITYLDKFISSVKMTLEKYFPDEEIFQQKIIGSIREVCSNNKS